MLRSDKSSHKLRVIVSNATRLHAHHHAFALQEAGMLDWFCTTFWYKPERAIHRILGALPQPLSRATESFFSKRSHPGLRPEKVKEFRWAEVLRVAADLITFGRFSHPLNFLQKQLYDRAVARFVARRRPDVFVGFEISCSRSMAAAKRVGAVTILDLAGLEHTASSLIKSAHLDYSPDRWVEKQLARTKKNELALADHCLCVSQFAKTSLINAGFDEQSITVVNPGVNRAVFSPTGEETGDKKFRLLYVGNLSRAKGVDLLIDVFSDLGLKQAELVLVGSGADMAPEELKRKNVIVKPYLSSHELADEYRACSLFVLPSLLDSWGMVVPEAMACGKPVIVTENCGCKELVDANNGWVIKAGDKKALKTAILEASKRRDKLSEMGQRAANAVASLTWERYGRSISKSVIEVHSKCKKANATV